MKLAISDELSLPLKFLSLRTVVYGGSGAGKTTYGRVVYEEATKAGVLCGAIDLKGDWWGLKSTADGRGDGIPVVIFGGEHQDVPLDEQGGASLAEIVVDLRQPFVIDLENLSRAKQMRFLAAFFERLYDKNREPLALFCDEADRYAPQKPMSPEANICLGAVEDIAKRGRKHGIFPVFINQRNASLNKGVSELCDVAVVFRTPGPRDQEAVEEWFGTKATREQRDAVMEALAGLATGTGTICSAHPDVRLFKTVPIRQPETFDSSATPEIGKRRIEPKQLAKPDLERITVRMAATIEKAKAEDPRLLRQEIQRLSTELRAARAVTPAAAPTPRKVEQPRVHAADRRRLEEALKKARGLAAQTEGAIDWLKRHIERTQETTKSLGEAAVRFTEGATAIERTLAPAVSPPPRQPAPGPGHVERVRFTTRTRLSEVPPSTGLAQHRAQAPRPTTPGPVDGEPLAKRELAILIAAAQRHPQSSTDAQLGVLSGYSPRSSSYEKGVAALRRRGLMEGAGNANRPTAAGLAAAGAVDVPPTGPELLQWWAPKLELRARTLLSVIVGAGPGGIGMEELSAKSDYSAGSSSFEKAIAKLRRIELVYPGWPARAIEEFYA